MTGETIEIQGTYPIDDNEQILGALKAAQHNEFEEADDVYQAFGETAKMCIRDRSKDRYFDKRSRWCEL